MHSINVTFLLKFCLVKITLERYSSRLFEHFLLSNVSIQHKNKLCELVELVVKNEIPFSFFSHISLSLI